MWIFFSFCAAIFAGITTIFSKIGVNKINSNLATAIRTTVILFVSFVIVIITGTFDKITNISNKTLIFMILSAISTTLLWLSHFKALQLGDVNKVTSIDKISIVLTIFLSSILFKEKITIVKLISMLLIIFGAYLMMGTRNKEKNNKWLIYALFTAIFTSLSAVLGKLGLNEVEVNLGNFIRTLIVFLIIWTVVFTKRQYVGIKRINNKNWIFLILSGFTTAFSWICYYIALSKGVVGVVFSIEKLSIVVTAILSYIILKEKFNIKTIVGLITIIIGTFLLLV